MDGTLYFDMLVALLSGYWLHVFLKSWLIVGILGLLFFIFYWWHND